MVDPALAQFDHVCWAGQRDLVQSILSVDNKDPFSSQQSAGFGQKLHFIRKGGADYLALNPGRIEQGAKQVEKSRLTHPSARVGKLFEIRMKAWRIQKGDALSGEGFFGLRHVDFQGFQKIKAAKPSGTGFIPMFRHRDVHRREKKCGKCGSVDAVFSGSPGSTNINGLGKRKRKGLSRLEKPNRFC